MAEEPEVPVVDVGPLNPEERSDLQDAIDQDKELRWLEHDASVAERALLDAADGLRGEELRKLHRAHRDAQHRLAAAHAALVAFLAPQFKRRREARRHGDDHVVFTREEFRILSIEERARMDVPGRDGQRVAAELKQHSRDMLEARGWKPRVPNPTRGGRAPSLTRMAWQVRKRIGALLVQAAASGTPGAATTA